MPFEIADFGWFGEDGFWLTVFGYVGESGAMTWVEMGGCVIAVGRPSLDLLPEFQDRARGLLVKSNYDVQLVPRDCVSYRRLSMA